MCTICLNLQNTGVQKMKGYRRIVFSILLILAVAFLHGCGGGEKDKTEKSEEKKGVERAEVVESSTVEREPAEKADVRELKLGVIGPLTGEGAEYGQSVLAGVRLAIEEINSKGGIRGKKIELVSYDNRGELEATIEGVSHLIDDEHVVAILSSPTGWSTFAPTHQINQTRTLFFSVGTKRNIERSGVYIFRVGLPDKIAVEELIKLTTERLGYRNYALVTSSVIDYSLARSYLFKNAILNEGGRVVLEADTYNTYEGRNEVDRVAQKIKNTAGIDAIVYTGNAEEGGQFVKELRRIGVKLPVIGTEVFAERAFVEGAGDAIRGTIFYTAYAPEFDERTKHFARSYRKATGREPDVFSALAYDTSLLIARAIEKADSTVPSQVMEALLNIEDFRGITGRMSFTPQGEPIKHPFIYEIKSTGEDGRILLK